MANQIPFVVAVHWALVAYFIGSGSSSSVRDATHVVVARVIRDDHGAVGDEEVEPPNLTTNVEEDIEAKAAKQLIRRIPMGRRHYAKMKEKYLNNINDKYNKGGYIIRPMEEFFTNLKPPSVVVGLTSSSSCQKNSPISAGMMNRLIKYSPDFGRRKSLVGEIDMTELRESLLGEEEDLSSSDEEEEEEKEKVKQQLEMGTAPLVVNLRASKFERDFDYVEPLCKFRGMDFFLGDFPEKEIWKQPLLLK